MKSDPETLLSDAAGTISPRVFTSERRQDRGTTYFAQESVYERLGDDEAIHYLLVNRFGGVVIDSKEASRVETHTPHRRFRAAAVVTDRRVFFVIGRDEGDWQVDLEATDIERATLQGEFRKERFQLETTTETYVFRIRNRGSSDPERAVAYVQQHLVPDQGRGTDGNDPRSDDTVEVDSEETWVDGPECEEPVLDEMTAVTEEVARALRTAGYRTQRDLRDASIDELAAVDGMGNQLAMRIKLDVGG